ncbi:hypothetical protein C0J52_15511 [Blattella germanica]|nr:hypothetical protein C0J52_15511 [Blattella germanica]
MLYGLLMCFVVAVEGRLHGTRKSLQFLKYGDCHFCIVDITHFKGIKPRKHIPYLSILSSIAPLPHQELPIPLPPEYSTKDKVRSFSDDSHFSNSDESIAKHCIIALHSNKIG